MVWFQCLTQLFVFQCTHEDSTQCYVNYMHTPHVSTLLDAVTSNIEHLYKQNYCLLLDIGTQISVNIDTQQSFQ